MGILLLFCAIALTVLVGVAWTRRQGAVRGPRPADARAADWLPPGVTLGERATFVQFSAQVCSACRATDRVLGAVAARDGGVVHHELDVDDHLPLTTRLGIWHVPTVVLLDRDGAEIARMSGAVTPARAREALAVTEGITL